VEVSELEPSDNPVEGLENFYDYLWGTNEGWVYLPTKDPKSDAWSKVMFEWPKHKSSIVKHTLAKSAEGNEVYVAPVLFSEARPIKDNVKGSNFLWVDFDGNAPGEWSQEPPKSLDDAPEPSLRVMSSRSGHEHCYWKLAEFTTDIKFVEEKNRALAYKLKADTSGWDAGQVLRPPHTTNYKHDLPVRVLASRDKEFTREEFKGFEQVKQIVKESIDIDVVPDVTKVIAKHKWDDHHFDLFMSPSIEEGKRSSALMALGFFGAEMGMKDEEIYSILLNADDRWGKFKNRSDRKTRLLDIINRARQKHPTGLTDDTSFAGLLDENAKVDTDVKYVFGFDEFNQTEIHIEWVVEGLLEQSGMMVIVSAPGVGKTQFALQFSICCALGTPFLKWPIVRKMKILWFSLEMNHAALKYFTTQMAGGYTSAEIAELDRNLKIVPLGEVLPLDHEEGKKFLEALIEEYQPDGIILDSMGKVTTSSLSDEEKIKQLNAYYGRIRSKYGVFLGFIHHNRKASDNNKKPKELGDIYGNQYIAAETSSAINLWKESDGAIEVSTIKLRLAPEIKPFSVVRSDHLKFILAENQLGFQGLTGEQQDDSSGGSAKSTGQDEGPEPGLLTI
jgi:hypothetical protein